MGTGMKFDISKGVGKQTVNSMLPHLTAVAQAYGLKLHYAKDFALARKILVNLYCRELS